MKTEPTENADHVEGAEFRLGTARAVVTPEGGLWFPAARTLAVADLHLGRSERTARRGGPFLPPYETPETLTRLEALARRLTPQRVISVGDGFDDDHAARSLTPDLAARIARLTATCEWIWVAGNHDPAPPRGLGGRSASDVVVDGVVLRHIADPSDPAPQACGHFHPKATLSGHGRRVRRRCLLTDGRRAVLPAFGVYTGGLDVLDSTFDALVGAQAVAYLLPPGPAVAEPVRPVPRAALARR